MGAQNEKTNVAIIVDSDDDEIEISERKPIENKSSPKKSIIKKNDASPTEASNKQSAKTASSPQRSLNTSSPQRSVNASISQRSLNTSNPQRPLNASNPQRSLNASSPQRPPNTSNPQRPKDASSLTPQRATSIIQREPVLPPLMGKEPSVNVNRLFQRDNRVKALGKAKPKPRPQSANILNDLIGNDDGLAEILGEKPKTLPYSPSLDDMRARRPSGASQEQSCSSPRGNSDIILSPDRPIQYRSIFSLNGLDSPPAPSRKRPMASPEVNSPISRYAMEKRRVVYEVDDEDGEEEDLESYIYHVTSRRRLFEKEISEVCSSSL
jgi:hypothetical protein